MKQILFILTLVVFITSCTSSEPTQDKCEPYYYHITLEDTAMIITDHGRFVASVPYEKTGVLDSIFVDDNE